MRRLNLSTALTVAGDATTGTIAYSGLTSPTITEIGDNPDVSVSSGGVCTFAALGSGSEVVTVKVQDAAGYFIQGPVTITGIDTTIYMQLGMNLTSVNGYNGCQQFANVMYRAPRPEKFSGSGSWTWDRGLIAASVGTDQFRFRLFTGNGEPGWVNGTYTVRNPDGCRIAIGIFGTPTAYKAWTNETSFTVGITPSGANGVYFFVEGSLTNALGNIEVIMPGHVTSYDAGDMFNAQFISYLEGLAPPVLRFMDWGLTSETMETEWSDRSDLTGPTLMRSGCPNPNIPYELMFALAERIGAHPWICIPARATDDHITQFALLAATSLQSGKQLYVELGNEVWNGGYPWSTGYNWIAYLNHTRFTATANYAAQTFAKASHGLSDGQILRGFVTQDSIKNGMTVNDTGGAYWEGGTNLYVEVVDVDTFKLKNAAPPGGSYYAFTTKMHSVVFLDPAEAGKTTSTNTNYAKRSKEAWDILDAALGVDNVYHICGSQAAATAVTSGRMGVAGMTARADAVAVAPYFNGFWWGGYIATTSGIFTPAMWASTDNAAMYVGVYASGSTPTQNDIINSTGTGYVGSTHSTSYTNVDFWRGGSAGLSTIAVTNGTTYDVFFVCVDTGGNKWMNSMSVTATASATTTTTFDDYDHQTMRMMMDIKYVRGTETSHSAVSGGVPIISYEMGMDFNQDRPAEMTTLANAYFEDASVGEAVTGAFGIIASSGMMLGCQFSEASNGSSFSLANHYGDTSDPRYVAAAAFGGRVAQYETYLAIADVRASDIVSDPASFPQTVHTFADASLTYKIYSGNVNGNYAIVGNELHLVNDYNVNWTNGLTTDLTIFATNGVDADTFILTSALGPWYLPTALLDIDFETNRAYIDGTEYSDIADAVTAGDLVLSSGYYTAAVTLPTGYSVAVKGTTRADAIADFVYRNMYMLDDGTTNNIASTAHLWTAGGFTGYYSYCTSGGVNQLPALNGGGAFQTASGSGALATLKVASRYKANEMAISYNGTGVITDTSCTLPTFNRLIINNNGSFTAAREFGTIKRIAIVPDAVTDEELKALTTFVYVP